MHALEQIDSITLFIIVLGIFLFIWIFRAIFKKGR